LDTILSDQSVDDSDSWSTGTRGLVFSLDPCHTYIVNEVPMETAFVTPKSKKAKNRFHNMMESDPMCFIEQNKVNRFFLCSTNGKYFFWVDLNNDSDWIVEF
jgi:hypothetical protein